MIDLDSAVDLALKPVADGQPLAVILAGHNGSGKSTMWRRHLSDRFRMPLVNADRMMLAILPEAGSDGHLVEWAQVLRDEDQAWLRVAQRGVQSFVAEALSAHVPFAMETVFSEWRELPDGRTASKIDLIKQLQDAGYYVLLMFVGLADRNLSVARVSGRTAEGGHDVPLDRLRSRFPRTQRAIRKAATVANATIMLDNSRSPKEAFTVVRVVQQKTVLFDLRRRAAPVPPVIAKWLHVLAPVRRKAAGPNQPFNAPTHLTL